MLFMVDRIVPSIMVDPEVQWHCEVLEDKSTKKIPEKDRKPGVYYTDKLPFEDKMFLFQWASGQVDDPETFRQRPITIVADVADVQTVQHSAQRNPRRRRR
jgi:hypothetical protein